MNPSKLPSMHPSKLPSMNPSKLPSMDPSKLPSMNPSKLPSINPSKLPSIEPSKLPSALPSNMPTINCTDDPIYEWKPSSQNNNKFDCAKLSNQNAAKVTSMCVQQFFYPTDRDSSGQELRISDICNGTCNPL